MLGNHPKLDVCTATMLAPLVAMISYGESSDFLGLYRYFDLYVPSVNYVAMCFLVLAMRHICQRIGSLSNQRSRRDADQ